MERSDEINYSKDLHFEKVERSYYSTPKGWRLATFDEAMNGIDVIKQNDILKKWDRVRLLDGWITGAGYNFEMGNDFKGCLGYMLLVNTQAPGFAYADVDLTDSGKEVAFFLCVDDWNFEVVYWLFNSWSKSQIMDLAEVREGNIPLVKAASFKQMNESIGKVARKLGDLAGAALEKAENIRYDGKESIQKMLSGMLYCVTEEEEIVEWIGRKKSYFTYFDAEEYSLPESAARPEEVEEVFWTFVCDSFAGYVVEVCALRSLKYIRNMKKNNAGGNNFMMATLILLHLSDYRTDIIHEPIYHGCSNLCAAKIISHAAENGAGEMLRRNAMWRCYDLADNYGVLHKLLTIVATGKHMMIDEGKKLAGDIVEMLLACGAQPQKPFHTSDGRNTSLQLVAMFEDEDVGLEVAKALLGKVDEQSIVEFVNAADDEGRTALHNASEKGNAGICELLLHCGASLSAQDKNKMTALHYAVELQTEKATAVLLKSSLLSESLGLKDCKDRTPVDIAVANEDYVSIVNILSKTEKPEAYNLSQVNKEQLLRHSILLGSPSIVRMLFKDRAKLSCGDCDDDGRTALHLAAMCDDEDSAVEIIFEIMEPTEVKKMVVIRDKEERTALHEAAFRGRRYLCRWLLRFHPEVINIKDRYGRNSLYDAVKRESNDTRVFELLQEVYLKKEDRHEDDLVDRGGLTPLHVAASEGKAMHVKEFLCSNEMRNRYLRRGDMVGQTALHKAAKLGDNEIVEILLEYGAHPLRERDCDGRTAVHYAVQADIEDKAELVKTLLMRCTEEEKALLLWASAAGIGTADEKLSTDDSLHKFLSEEKKKYGGNLLRTAASIGQIEMTKELLSRGYPIEAIRDEKWIKGLSRAKQKNVTIVSKQIEMIKELGNDKPAIADSLGRLDYARGLAALFLNPYIQPPIAIGITGSWGMGKSSLMLQTERVLLTTAAHMALLQSSKLSSSASNLPDMEPCKLSKTGERKWKKICNHINYRGNRNIFVSFWHNLKSVLKKPSIAEVQQQLDDFLNDEIKNAEVFKALAAMDSSEMLENNMSRTKEEDSSGKQYVPAVLTVQYNAWKYKNDTEALAGLAVEITKELEGIVTPAQWLNTCWRYNWEKKKYTILLEIFIPYFFAMVLVSSLAWIAWIVLGSEKFKKWEDVKYAWPPAAAVVILWSLTRKVKGILQPISSQLRQYVSAPDHTDKLGYQERVISDIKFLTAEIGEKPNWVFIVFAWVLVLLGYGSVGKVMEALKISPASGSHLRIIVFVDDLDRCDESVILQVLSAVNLVLAVCEISVVLGMDKRLIEKAILNKHGDQNTGISRIDNQKLAEMYLQKIIQLPLDLPDPSDEQTTSFLRAQLGVLQQNEDNKESMDDDTISSSDDGEGEAGEQTVDVQVDIDEQITEIGREVRSQTNGDASNQQKSTVVDRKSSPYILQREILFVSYSEGEEKAFLYFQRLATECRKLPRECKRLLNYHRLVWYIFSVSDEANKLNGWQVQLIAWICVCWEWEENMDFVIKKWKEIVNTPESKGYSLLMIVEKLMEEHERGMKAEDSDERTQTKNNEGEGSVGEKHNDEESKSSSSEVEEENEKNASSKKLVKIKNATSMKLGALGKSMAKMKVEMAKMEKEIKALKEVVSNEMHKQIRELQKQLSGEMKKDMNELKRQIVSQQNGTQEENIEPEKLKMQNLENWKRMKKALERYDVPMEGIHAFQRFRFYCIAGYLPSAS